MSNDGVVERNYLRDLHVRLMPIASLTPHASNPRTHSPKQVRQIAESIKKFGFVNPILTDSNGGVIAGHGRIEAAKLLAIKMVPTIPLAELTEAQKRAYILADNKLAENAGWDHELLALELNYIAELDVDFDMTITGFETAELDLLINPPDSTSGEQGADEFCDVDRAQPTVSRPGDLWLLGEHRLLCGDATENTSFELLLEVVGRKWFLRIRRITYASTDTSAALATCSIVTLLWRRGR